MRFMFKKKRQNKTYPQHFQLIFKISFGECDCRCTWYISRFQFCHQIIDRQWMDFLILWKCCYCVPFKLSDKSYTSWIVGWVGRNGTIKQWKFTSVTECWRCWPKWYLELMYIYMYVQMNMGYCWVNEWFCIFRQIVVKCGVYPCVYIVYRLQMKR